MGNICPCPRRRKAQQYPYDVHEQTFEIEDNAHNLTDNSPKNVEDNENHILTDDLRSSQESQQRSPFHQEATASVPVSTNQFAPSLNKPSHSEDDLTSTKVALVEKMEEQPMIPKIQEPKKIEQPPKYLANILKPAAPRPKYNPDDYRFKDETGSFKVKKIDSIKEQQYNIANCNNCSFFIFDITANIYIDDTNNCIIFAAPVESTIFVRNCRNLTVIAVTGQFRTYECHDCVFSIYCKSQPVIESSSGLVFSPFNSPVYQELPKQIKKKKFQPWNNHWSQIHNFTKKEGEKHHRLEQYINLDAIDWKQAFDLAELQITELKNPIPLIKGDLSYEPKQEIVILLNADIQDEFALKALKQTVILKANQAPLQGQGRNPKRAILVDCLEFMPEKFEQLGIVFSDPQEVEEKKQKWFVTFGDQRAK